MSITKLLESNVYDLYANKLTVSDSLICRSLTITEDSLIHVWNISGWCDPVDMTVNIKVLGGKMAVIKITNLTIRSNNTTDYIKSSVGTALPVYYRPATNLQLGVVFTTIENTHNLCLIIIKTDGSIQLREVDDNVFPAKVAADFDFFVYDLTLMYTIA